ncbi:hypothetical protein R6Q57_011254 [Mikania cordata]
MHANIKGKQKEIFLAFPRFIQIIIKKRHQNLVPVVGTLCIKRMKEDIFPYMTMNKKEKFGRFSVGLDEEVEDQGTPTAFVTYEHDLPPAGTTQFVADELNLPPA